MNGTIKAQVVVGSSIDSYGEPTQGTVAFGDSVPCKYVSNNRSNRGTYTDGIFTQAEFILTIKDMSFSASRIKLFDSKGVQICEKQVQSLEVLEDVKRIKITI
jgi:hypothetical protein